LLDELAQDRLTARVCYQFYSVSILMWGEGI